MKKLFAKLCSGAISTAMICAALPFSVAHAEPLLYSSFDSNVENYFSSSHGKPAVRDTEKAYHGAASALLAQESGNDALRYDIPLTFTKGQKYRISAKVSVDNPKPNTNVRFQITGSTETGVDFVGFVEKPVVGEETWYRSKPVNVTDSNWMELEQIFTVTGGEADIWSGKVAVWVTGDDKNSFNVDDFTVVPYTSLDDVLGASAVEYHSFEETVSGVSAYDGTVTHDTTKGFNSSASAKISINHQCRWLGGIARPADFEKGNWYKLSAMVYADAEMASKNGKARFWIIDGSQDIDLLNAIDWKRETDFTDRYAYYSNAYAKLNEGWNEVSTFVYLNSALSDGSVLKLIVDEPTQSVAFTYNVDDYKIEKVDAPEYFDDFKGSEGTCGWYDYASALSYDDTMKALKVEKLYGFSAAGHKVGLQQNQSYIAKAKIYVPSSQDISSQDATLCVVNTDNYNNDSTYYAKTVKTVETDKWVDMEAFFIYSSDSGDEFDINRLIIGTDSKCTYFVKDVELYKTNLVSYSTFEAGIDGWNEYVTSLSSVSNVPGSTGALKIVKNAGYGKIYKPITLEKNKNYKLKARAYVPSGMEDVPVTVGIIPDDITISGTELSKFVAYAQKTYTADTWIELETEFQYTGETAQNLILSHMDMGGEQYYYLDDITVEETDFKFTDGNFDNGMGAWKAGGANIAASNEFATAGHTNSLKVYDRVASYTMAFHEINLEKGKTYTAKGKMYIPGDAPEAKYEAKFMINKFENNTNFDANCIAYDTRMVGPNSWESFETTFEYNGDDETVYLSLFPHEGGNLIHYLSDIEVFEANADDGKTAGITSVYLDDSLNPIYTANADADYILQYSYTSNGEVVKAGYIINGEQLPVLKNVSGDIQLTIMPILFNGKVEEKVVSNVVAGKGDLEINSFTINDGDEATAIKKMSDIGENGIYTALAYNNNTGKEINANLFVAFYDDADKLISVELKDVVLAKGNNTVEYPSYDEDTLAIPQNAVRISAFLWDNDLTPFACYKVAE